MNRGRTSVTFPEKAYLFGTTAKELVLEKNLPWRKPSSENNPRKNSSGSELPPPGKSHNSS
jgi:hypothetical protein